MPMRDMPKPSTKKPPKSLRPTIDLTEGADGYWRWFNGALVTSLRDGTVPLNSKLIWYASAKAPIPQNLSVLIASIPEMLRICKTAAKLAGTDEQKIISEMEELMQKAHL